MSAGISGQKLPLWAEFPFLIFYCKTHSKPPSQNPSEKSPPPPEPSQNPSYVQVQEPFLERCVAGRPLMRAPNFGDKFGESLGGSQAPPSFWEVPGLPRKFPELPRKFFGDVPGRSLTVELNRNPEVPRKFPKLPRKFPKLPRKFPDFPGGQPLSLGSLTPSPDSQKLSLTISDLRLLPYRARITMAIAAVVLYYCCSFFTFHRYLLPFILGKKKRLSTGFYYGRFCFTMAVANLLSVLFLVWQGALGQGATGGTSACRPGPLVCKVRDKATCQHVPTLWPAPRFNFGMPQINR